MWPEAALCFHFMVSKIIKKLRVIIDKHVSLFTPETFLHVYMTIFLVSIVHFENKVLVTFEFIWLLHLVTNETQLTIITDFGSRKSPFTVFISNLLSRLPYSVYDFSSSWALIECAIILNLEFVNFGLFNHF